jgi:hypothetical protein
MTGGRCCGPNAACAATPDPGTPKTARMVPGDRDTGTEGTRAERLAIPPTRDVVKDVAAEHGACLRPVQLRRTEIDTGHVEQVLIPCGHTLASVCPPCAERARMLRTTVPGRLAPGPRTGDRSGPGDRRAESPGR